MDSDEAVARAAARLRELRRERRISQRHLADEAGVSPALVNRVERGRRWQRQHDGLCAGKRRI